MTSLGTMSAMKVAEFVGVLAEVAGRMGTTPAFTTRRRTCLAAYEEFLIATESDPSAFLVHESQGVFRVPGLTDEPLLIPGSQARAGDPELLTYEAGSIVEFGGTAAAVLASEYAFRRVARHPFRFATQFDGYGIYQPIKAHWELLFNPTGYPNKIWASENTVLVILNELSCIVAAGRTLTDIAWAADQLGASDLGDEFWARYCS